MVETGYVSANILVIPRVDMRLMLKTILSILCVAVLLSACDRQGAIEATREELNPPTSAYTNAAPCSAEDAACQTLLDMYERKPGFKEQLVTALEASGVARPLWLESALSTRLLRTTYQSSPLIIGRVCEPRNCAQLLYVAYGENGARVFGFYRSNERLQWFGDPDADEKSRLCEEDPVCSLESKVSELPSILARWSYPTLIQAADFANCTELKGGITAKDGFVCAEQFAAKCPFSAVGCTVSGQFVGDQAASLSFKYKYRNVKYDDMRKALDKAYGTVEPVVIQPEATGKVSSSVSVWKDGRVQITLRRVKGVNALGERYDDVWIVFEDRAFALFN